MCCCFVLEFQTTIPISSYCSLLSPPCSWSTLSRALPLLDSPTQWVRTFSSWTSRFLNCVSVLFLQQCSNLKVQELGRLASSTSRFCLSRSTVLSVFFTLSTCSSVWGISIQELNFLHCLPQQYLMVNALFLVLSTISSLPSPSLIGPWPPPH